MLDMDDTNGHVVCDLLVCALECTWHDRHSNSHYAYTYVFTIITHKYEMVNLIGTLPIVRYMVYNYMCEGQWSTVKRVSSNANCMCIVNDAHASWRMHACSRKGLDK